MTDYLFRLRIPIGTNFFLPVPRRVPGTLFYDNAVAESFFSTLKNELVAGSVFESRERARVEIFNYIEGFYNRQRIHQSLNYLTPEEAEKRAVVS